ncbi:unnamed protein product, partial [marine sediment metagenome]
DDRIGFYRGGLSTSSSNVMSIQMDPGGSGMNIEGYWDGVGAADQRPSIVDLTGLLAADSWYRLQTTFTKTAIANEPIIDVTLHAVNGDGSTGALVVSATLDTATLPAADRPHTKYFSGTAYPAYKNHSGGFVDNALAIIDDDSPPPIPPPPPPPAGSFEVLVAQGNDDAEEHLNEGPGNMDLGSSDLELGSEGGGADNQLIGIRFQDLPLPAGSTIESASIQFTTKEPDDEATSLVIFGEALINPPAFGSDQ